jgi:hypothetical protein
VPRGREKPARKGNIGQIVPAGGRRATRPRPPPRPARPARPGAAAGPAAGDPVLVGSVAVRAERKAAAIGAEACLSRPFSVAKLLDEVGRLASV